MNILIGDIGNTVTKVCLVRGQNYKIDKIIYLDSKKIYSKKKLNFLIKNIIKINKTNKFALFSSVVPKYCST